MDYTTLKTELDTDPLIRNYAAMTDAEAAASLAVADRQMNVNSVTGQEIFEATVPAEYNALPAASKDLFHAIIGMGTVLVNGTNTKAALLAMFGVGTTTRANLAALQKRAAGRWEEIGLGREVNHGDVAWVRREMMI